MSQLVFSRGRNPEVGPNASKGMALLARTEQAGKKQKLPSSTPAVGVSLLLRPRLQASIVTPQDPDKKWFYIKLKQNGVRSRFAFSLNPDVVNLE